MSGVVTISLELELGWGVHQHDGVDVLSENRQRETETLSRLLSLCDSLDIALTFDVVGHLFRERPLPSYDGPHPEGWFDHVDGVSGDPDPLFYAPDLVAKIRGADVDHEICTHTFSHVECGRVSEDTVRWELERVHDEHQEVGLDLPTSFVPPRHSIPSYEILDTYGLETIRVPDPSVATNRARTRKALEILSGKHPVLEPKIVDGLVESYTTERISLATPLLPSGQQPPHRAFRPLPVSVRQRLHRRSLKQMLSTVEKTGSYAHIWSHVWDIANDSQWPQVREFLQRLAEHERNGDVTLLSMGELNDTIRATGEEQRV